MSTDLFLNTTDNMGVVVAWCQTVNRGYGGSIPPTGILKHRQFRSRLPVSFGRDTKSQWSLIYMMSMPGEVKDPTQGVNV